ncbi:hypothetical protein IEO21_01242 [Rhodonia placenta]|uniref:Uncharacterized protein n=1 Tax=Rhodonia placenta TaxID=104341 RepID=A0A8H7PA67_9APHY|nr:hypothetical protein IEO21_01242 [Postia placenta]
MTYGRLHPLPLLSNLRN